MCFIITTSQSCSKNISFRSIILINMRKEEWHSNKVRVRDISIQPVRMSAMLNYKLSFKIDRIFYNVNVGDFPTLLHFLLRNKKLAQVILFSILHAPRILFNNI